MSQSRTGSTTPILRSRQPRTCWTNGASKVGVCTPAGFSTGQLVNGDGDGGSVDGDGAGGGGATVVVVVVAVSTLRRYGIKDLPPTKRAIVEALSPGTKAAIEDLCPVFNSYRVPVLDT